MKTARKSLEIIDLASPWCDAGEETWRLFFQASLRCLQNVQKMGRFTPKCPELDELAME